MDKPKPKQFFKLGQKVFYAIHPDRKSIPFNMSDFDRKNNIGKIVELEVVGETPKILTTKLLSPVETWSERVVFSKWPQKYFGDGGIGPFSTVAKCQEYLKKSMPVFDHDGNLTN